MRSVKEASITAILVNSWLDFRRLRLNHVDYGYLNLAKKHTISWLTINTFAYKMDLQNGLRKVHREPIKQRFFSLLNPLRRVENPYPQQTIPSCLLPAPPDIPRCGKQSSADFDANRLVDLPLPAEATNS